MTHFNSPNVHYLEDTELYIDYSIRSDRINPRTGQPFFYGPTVVMIQGEYCGYCTQVKPIFQRIADEMTADNAPIEFATIQIDGKEVGEQIFHDQDTLTRILKKPLEGVPLIVKFIDGYPVQEYTGEREYEQLRKWVLN